MQNWQRWTTFAVCLASMATLGIASTFSLYSEELKSRLSFTSSDLNLISGIELATEDLSFLLAGPVVDKFGSQVAVGLGAMLYSLGCLLAQLAYRGLIMGTRSTMILYYILVGSGSTFVYLAALKLIVVNFGGLAYEGVIMGVALLFYGLSPMLFAQIFGWFFAGNIQGYLMFIAVTALVVNLLTVLITSATRNGMTSRGQPSISAEPAKHVDKITIAEETNSLISGTKDNFGTFAQVGQDVRRLQSIEDALPNQCIEGGDTIDLQEPQLQDGSMHYSMRRTPSITPSKIENGSFMTPKQILRAPVFWSFALVFVFIQGFTYNLNFIQILQATLQEPNSTLLSAQNTRHVTIMSFSQSVGRFLAPILLQRVSSSYRPSLLCLAQVLILAPTVVLAHGVYAESLLYFASTCMQFGLGLALASHVVLTEDFFGAKYFATACAFSIACTPIGILGSNFVFGQLYDRDAGTGTECLNANCYSKAFVIFSVFQGVALCFSLVVFYLRWRKPQ
ncbi:major facilitator superfamily domain-containing protein [Chytriomyces cf. hyalinus JEL632]|nr:major facilitator superfamily domain-containing protein [Chytriomyces cf. hyalinus JEL632]